MRRSKSRLRQLESTATGARLRSLGTAYFPALTRPSLSVPTLTMPTLNQALTSGWHVSKLLSGFVLLTAISALVWIQSDERWFVYADSVEFTGVTYLEHRDLLPMSGVATWNIFWLRPEDIRENLLQHPYVADADVRIFLPNHVRVSMSEPQPVAVWMTKSGPLWILGDGAVLEIRIPPGRTLEEQLLDRAGAALPVLVDMQRAALSVTRLDLAVDEEVLHSALTLIERLPDITQMRYNSGFGLNFALPNTPYWVYWGDGADLDDKLARLRMTQDLLESGEVRGQVIDVRFDDRLVVR